MARPGDSIDYSTSYTHATTGPATSLRAVLLWDTNRPASVEASVIAANESSTEYLITCASSCPSSSFPVQTVTHQSGTLWEGERTWDGTTTQWWCKLGSPGAVVVDKDHQLGLCQAITHTSDEVVTTGEPTTMNTCFIYSRSVMAYVTGGMDKIYKFRPYYDTGIEDADEFNSFMSSKMASLGCPVTSDAGTVAARTTADITATQTLPTTSTDKADSNAASATTAAEEADSSAASATEAAETTSTSGGAVMPKSLVMLAGTMLLAALIHV